MKRQLVLSTLALSVVVSLPSLGLAQADPKTPKSTVSKNAASTDAELEEEELTDLEKEILLKNLHLSVSREPDYDIPEPLRALPEDQQKRFLGLLAEAMELMSEDPRRIQESLHNLYEAEQILPDYMMLHSLLGSAYLNIRDHQEARKSYEKAQKIHYSVATEINRGELELVDGKFKAAEAIYSRLLSGKGLSNSQAKLINFKKLICHLEMKDRATAELILKRYSPTEESPIYMLGKAAFGFHDKDFKEASRWVEDAGSSCAEQEFLLYLDALAEVYYRRDIEAALSKLNRDNSTGGLPGSDDE